MKLLPSRDRPWVNLALLLLTLASTFLVYFTLFASGTGSSLASRVPEALTFSVSLLLILGSHEMGHYVWARKHGVQTSLPYFIPVPFGLGTMGAVIRLRSPIPTRNALVDIGASGPIAGILVAICVLAVGFARSHVESGSDAGFVLGGGDSLVGALRTLFHEAVARLNHHALPSAAAGPEGLVLGDSLLMLGLQRLFVGPVSAQSQIASGPLLLAGWFGVLVTMLNLLPIGQLDGGHVAFAVLGDRASLLGRAMAAVLLFLSLWVSWSWLLWFLLTTFVIGVRHPPVLHPLEPLTRRRKQIAILCAVLLVICFMPLPTQLRGT